MNENDNDPTLTLAVPCHRHDPELQLLIALGAVMEILGKDLNATQKIRSAKWLFDREDSKRLKLTADLPSN